MIEVTVTDGDIDRFKEVATRMAGMCREGKYCPTPIYCGCPFKHVSEMPRDCMKTTAAQWIVLLKCLSELEGTI